MMRKSKPCCILNCYNLATYGKMCEPHRYKQRRYGDPFYIHEKFIPKFCNVVGCEKPYYSNGCCNKHHQQNKRNTKWYKKWFNEYKKTWRKNNPKSQTTDYKLTTMMNMVRLRDNNTCQWFGCNKTHKETTIHVHHIFPRSEYPELQYVEKYMICYCVEHHKLWHKVRGDRYHSIINKGKNSRHYKESLVWDG